ncbi:MAG: serine hydroxymethyltransferase [Thermoplasmata archaeon]|jgi:glycine hydroxymethyltransferase
MVTRSPDEQALARWVRAHNRWRGREVFNLLPSENALSPTAKRYLSSDLAGRYTLPISTTFHGEAIDNSYAGTRYTDRIEELGNRAASRIFHGRRATVRPLSGHIAALSAMAPLLPSGSKLLAIPPEQGGYDGYAPGFIPALFGWKVRPLPADGPGGSLVIDQVLDVIRAERPDAVLLGQSFFLFPYPVREIAEEIHRQGGLLFYDASHVLGLIAGGVFQDPIREGTDVLFGSTHKSFFGPQGGLLVTDREDLFQQIDPALVWRIFDNAHWNRIAALTQTLLEFERVGPEYARTVVENSQRLARELTELGWPMVAEAQGFSGSHQIHIDPRRFRERFAFGPGELARRLEAQGLILDLVGRIGTAELTRLGVEPREMGRLARLLHAGGIQRSKVGAEVRAWRSKFPALRFV